MATSTQLDYCRPFSLPTQTIFLPPQAIFNQLRINVGGLIPFWSSHPCCCIQTTQSCLWYIFPVISDPLRSRAASKALLYSLSLFDTQFLPYMTFVCEVKMDVRLVKGFLTDGVSILSTVIILTCIVKATLIFLLGFLTPRLLLLGFSYLVILHFQIVIAFHIPVCNDILLQDYRNCLGL